MKKLLLFIMLLAFSLVGCQNADTNDFANKQEVIDLEKDLEAQIADLQLQITLLQERLDNLISVQGINGQTVYYEQTIIQMKSQLNQLLETNFNPDLAPTYMYDENGDYITFDKLGELFNEKYFYDRDGEGSHLGVDRYEMIPYAFYVMIFEDSNLNVNDAVARVILMVEELTKYEYYSLSSNGIKIWVIYDDGLQKHQVQFEIPTVILINDMFTLNFESLIRNQFESYFSLPEACDTLNYNDVKTFYDAYVLAGTFSGYVLNYNG